MHGYIPVYQTNGIHSMHFDNFCNVKWPEQWYIDKRPEPHSIFKGLVPVSILLEDLVQP